MQSVLNETSFFDAVKKAAADSANGYLNDKKLAKNSTYLGGSIARYTKNLIMSFPVMVDNTISFQSAQMISKANERKIINLLQMMFASMSLEGTNGKDVLASLHMNMDADIDDIIDAIDRLCESGAISNAECRDAIREMVYQLKTPAKSFPAESLNERSLNDFQVRNMNGNLVVIERSSEDENRYNRYKAKNDNFGLTINTDDKYSDEKNERERRRDDREEEKRGEEKEKRGEEREKRAEEREKARRDARSSEDIDRKSGKQDSRDRDAANAGFTKQILDNDIKKANELQPSLMIVNFNNIQNGQVVDKKSFIAGVKSRMVSIDAMDIVERLVSQNKSRLSFKNFIRSTTGEISFIKDFLLAMKQQKLNAKNAAKRGGSAQMWNLLSVRGTANSVNKLRRKGNDASAITTLVVNAETVNYMISAYNFDLNSPKNAKLIMDAYNLLGIIIADDANEYIRVIYDGNNQYEEVAYSGLSKEMMDKEYKKVVNLINKAGR